MIEQVINRRNMLLAYMQVFANKGSAGVDGMQYLCNLMSRCTCLPAGKYEARTGIYPDLSGVV